MKAAIALLSDFHVQNIVRRMVFEISRYADIEFLGSLLPEVTGPHYYVATGVYNATKNRWEQHGPFLSYEEAWEWVESEWWLKRPRTP